MRHCSALQPVRFPGLVVILRKVSGAHFDVLIFKVKDSDGHCQVAGGQPLLGPIFGDTVIPVEFEITI